MFRDRQPLQELQQVVVVVVNDAVYGTMGRDKINNNQKLVALNFFCYDPLKS